LPERIDGTGITFRRRAPVLGAARPSVYYCRCPKFPSRVASGNLRGFFLAEIHSPRLKEPGPPVYKPLVNFLLLGLLLAAVWLLFSGLYKPVLLGLGVVSVLITLLITWRMNIVDATTHPIWAAIRYVPYWPWLGIEIIKSSFDVARRVLSPSMPISPTVVDFDSSQQTMVGRVVLANSITLTPGTVTLDVDGQRLRVHALSRDTIAALLEGEMDRRISRAEARLRAPRPGEAGAP